MLTVKGIYEDNEIKLLEPLDIEGKHVVEIRFIELDSAKKAQIEAFRNAHGIWKDRPEVDEIFKEIRNVWQDFDYSFYSGYNNNCFYNRCAESRCCHRWAG